MKIDLTFVNNEWLRGVLATSVAQKAEALLTWSQNKELELQSEISDELSHGTQASEVANVKLERLVERYERQQQNTTEIAQAYQKLCEVTGYKPQARVASNDAVARAKAIIKKKAK